MKIFGIVCEYNPLHAGHMYHIYKCIEKGADAIVCVMSGNFVQRADFALFSKHARAEAAIYGGADLVIELPTPWAIASAERFALGAVSILNDMGCVDTISFGCETPNASLLERTAEALLSEDFSLGLKRELKLGVSFAGARERAMSAILPDSKEVIALPNNILAIEYIKALKTLSSKMKFDCVERVGSKHDAPLQADCHPCSSEIRALPVEQALSLLPECSKRILLREIESGRAPVRAESADSAVMACLKKLSADELLEYADVSEGLESRITDAIASAVCVEEVLRYAKSKRYALSRLRRIILSAFLNIPKEIAFTRPQYARVLAFSDTGREVIKRANGIPIITKPSLLADDKIFRLESRCTDLYSLFMPKMLCSGEEFRESPRYISDEALENMHLSREIPR